MQPKAVVDDGSADLFRSRLLAMIDLRHELVKLGKALDWSVFDEAFARLGRVIRDIRRKIDGNADLEALFAEPLARAERIQTQKQGDKGKLYAFHAPEVECLGKGKPKTRYEFGVKVSVAATNAVAKDGQFVVGMQSLPGHPYDGHSLQAQIEQTTRLTGTKPKRVYVDHGYRSHDADNKKAVFISGQKRGLTPTTKRELKRRNAVEPVIGHMESDGLLDRNHLNGAHGDAINAILAAAGHNLRLLARWLIIVLGKTGATTDQGRRRHHPKANLPKPMPSGSTETCCIGRTSRLTNCTQPRHNSMAHWRKKRAVPAYVRCLLLAALTPIRARGKKWHSSSAPAAKAAFTVLDPKAALGAESVGRNERRSRPSGRFWIQDRAFAWPVARAHPWRVTRGNFTPRCSKNRA